MLRGWASAFGKFRASRDAVTDQLYDDKEKTFSIGWTPPILDIEIARTPSVEYNAQANIVLKDSQVGVTYYLRNRYGKPLTDIHGEPLTDIKGTLGTGINTNITLKTPPLEGDSVFRIEAIKDLPFVTNNPIQRRGFLKTPIRVKAGIRTTGIGVELVTPLKDKELAYGTKPIVQLTNIQADVEYYLTDITGQTILSGFVLGEDTGTILLTTTENLTDDKAFHVYDRRGDGIVPKQITPNALWVQVGPNPDIAVEATSFILKSGDDGVTPS